MLKMILVTTVALYGGFIVWGEHDANAEASSVRISPTVPQSAVAGFDKPVILSGSGQDAVVTRAAVTDIVVPDAAAIAASAPVPGSFEPSVIGEPVVVSLVQPGAAPATTEDASVNVEGLLRVSGSAVNLRAGPSTGNAVVGSLAEGTLAEPIGDEIDGWIEILDVAGGLRGYMAARFLEPA